MKVANRLALADAAGIFALWALLTFGFGTWRSQIAGLVSLLTIALAVGLVFWRVRSAYSSGSVGLHRALIEGAASGAALAVILQVIYWLAWMAVGDASFGTISSSGAPLNLAKEAALSAVAGAAFGGVLWAANTLVLRRAGP